MKSQQNEQCKRELYEVPPNTPTEFMVQFFACMERKGLLNRPPVRNMIDHSGKDTDSEQTCDDQVVGDQKLKKQRSHSPNLHERLLREIRSNPKLRPVRGGKLVVERTRPYLSMNSYDDSPSPPKQLIRPDFNIFQYSFEESSGDEDVLKSCSLTSSPLLDISLTSGTTTPPPSPPSHRADAFLFEEKPERPARLQRRHTINICEMRKERKNNVRSPIEYLSLTLEELSHIRSVFTKAELESLAWNPELYQQVFKRKLCFTCRTTRFTLFGEWGTRCKICQRTVCSKCIRKMNVPTDHFRNIPVYSLSPSLLTGEIHDLVRKTRHAPAPSVPQTRASSPTRDEEKTYQQKTQHTLRTSDLMKSLDEDIPNKMFMESRHAHTTQSSNKSDPRKKSLIKQSLKGTMMAICCECRLMVIEIVRSSRQSLPALSLQNPSRQISTSNLSKRKTTAGH